MKHVQFNRHEA